MIDSAGIGNSFAKSSMELVTDIKKAEAYVIVYDTTSAESLTHAKTYFDQILQIKGSDWVPATLVGTKTDLQKEREVKAEEPAELAKSWGCPHLEVRIPTPRKSAFLVPSLSLPTPLQLSSSFSLPPYLPLPHLSGPPLAFSSVASIG